MGIFQPAARKCRPSRLYAALVAACSLGAVATSLRANPADATAATPDTVYVVPAIIVEARREDRRAELFGRAGFSAVVDVRPRRARVEDLSNLLTQLVGVRVKQYGGLGSFATVSIRGASSSQVSVFLDGVPMNDPYMGITNLADLPLGAIQQIEVYRGFAPASLGGSAIGGAINLVTSNDNAWNRAVFLSRAEAHTSAGSFGTRQIAGSAWFNRSQYCFFLSGDRTNTNGDFSFLDNNETPFNPDDDRDTVRVNNSSRSWHFLLNGEKHFENLGQLIVSHDRFRREQGVPGLGSYQSAVATANRERSLTNGRVISNPLWSQLTLEFTGFYSRSNEQFVDPGGSISMLSQSTDNTINVYGGRVRGRWIVPSLPLSLELVNEGRKETYHPIRQDPTRHEGPDQWRRARTTGMTAELYLLDQNLMISGTQRWQENNTEFYDAPALPSLPPIPQGRLATTASSPSAGVRWQIAPFLITKANVGRYYRLPTFIEMFGNAGSVTGNPAIKPEEGFNRDVGIVLRSEHCGPLTGSLIEVSYLDNKVDSLILFFPNSQYTSRPTNILSARIRGWEVSAAGFLSGQYQLGINYTYMDSKDTSAIPHYRGKSLPSRPTHNLNTSITGPAGPARVTYEYQFIGANYTDRSNMTSLAARHLHNVVLKLNLGRTGFAFMVEGRNLTDNQMSDVNGFPMPGRSIYSTISFTHDSQRG